VVKARLEDDLGLSMVELGGIETAYLAVYAIGQFISGSLGDRYGARRVLGLGMIGSAICAWMLGVSSLLWPIGVAFALNAAFQSTGWSNNVKAMTPWFSLQRRGLVMAFWSTNFQVGGLVATALAGYLLVTYGWRTAFHVPATWVATIGALVLLFLVERPQDAGLEPVLGGQDEGEGRDREAFWRMLRVPAVWALGSSYFCLKFIRYSLLFWLPYYLHTQLGYAEDTSAYLSTAFEAGGIAGTIGVGYMSDRLAADNRPRLLAPVLLVLAVLLGCYETVGAMGLWPNAVAMGLIGFTLFGPDALLAGAVAQDLGGERAAASTSGIINGMGSVGAILTGLIVPYVGTHYGWDALFFFFVALAILSAAALLPLALRKRPAVG
jgi:sugar phosphate permease